VPDFFFGGLVVLDNSNMEDLFNDDIEQYIVLLAAKELEDRKKKRPGSKVNRLCIPRNRMLGYTMLMRDYFTKVPTYPAHHFRRRYRMRRSLFVKIVQARDMLATSLARGMLERIERAPRGG
jgi:hypothetical protein